jgi:hypothetical protein
MFLLEAIQKAPNFSRFAKINSTGSVPVNIPSHDSEVGIMVNLVKHDKEN